MQSHARFLVICAATVSFAFGQTAEPPLPVSVTVTPRTSSILAGGQILLEASVTGTLNSEVTWNVSPGEGSISPFGLYTAPAAVSAVTDVMVTATSMADGTRMGFAVVTVNPVVGVAVSPAASSIAAGGTVQLSAVVTGSANTGVTWSLSPALGSLSTNGNSAVYAAPSVIQQNQVVEVRAVSAADPTKIASIVVTLAATVAVSITPDAADVLSGGTKQFGATVVGTANTGVQWSVTPQVGTVSQTGLYQAPMLLAAQQAVSVKATSVADATKSAAATVTVRPQAAQAVEYTFDSSRLTSLTFNGVSYYLSNDFLVDSMTFRSPEGVKTNYRYVPISSAVRTRGENPDYYRHVYRNGQKHQYTIKVVWSTPDQRTVRADAYVTNNDVTDQISNLRISPLQFNLPGPPVDSLNRLHIGLQSDDLIRGPVDILRGEWGSAAIWQDSDSPHSRAASYFNKTLQTEFRMTSDSSIVRTYEKTGTKEYTTLIAPGETKRFSLSMRIGGRNEVNTDLAGDAYEQFRGKYPNQVNWPDRRPIANWFIAEGTKRSATNPRGYLAQPTLNVSDLATFRTGILRAADQTLGVLNNMSVRPQGLIVWDLDGQEFNHAFTYVGAPHRLADLAPEMDAVADELFRKFTDAGYRVGVTLRPQSFGSGPNLPQPCRSNSSIYDLTDKFIKTTEPFPVRSFVCVSQNQWKQNLTGTGPGSQTSTDDDEEILDTLRARVAYARSRWGATLFYVDSNVYMDGRPILPRVFRQLGASFPDCLFIPEWDTSLYFGVAAPFKYALQEGYETAPGSKTLYPNAFSTIYVGDATLSNTSVRDRLVNAVKSGDILLFRGWFRNSDVSVVESVYQLAGQP